MAPSKRKGRGCAPQGKKKNPLLFAGRAARRGLFARLPLKCWPLMASLGSVIVPLQGQADDWIALEKLAPGTAISVVVRGRQSCQLLTVTDSELDCACWIGDVNRERVFARVQIREVRIEEPDDNRTTEGAVLGTFAGVLVGALVGTQAKDPETRGYMGIYSVPVGAFVGGVIGKNFHRHGPVIYRR